ncbi:MAG: iron-sulfur cluster assembly scaffold protein [Candidatus Aminicenantes bacterium]|nr:iron-sulfur cluster assembly scaffold protein [Candidatus Aminicenantes bacterium]
MQKHDSDAATLTESALEKLRKHYNETVVEHCLHPRNFRKMNAPDGYTKHKGPDGDIVEIFVRLDNKRVTECTFQIDGCAATLACGSIATELIKGKLYADALDAVSPKKIIQALGGLPEGNIHCAHKISQALKLAIADGLVQKQSPWKKHYRRY